MYSGNYRQDCYGMSSIQQEENSFHQQNGLKFKEETSTVPHLEPSLVRCWNLDTSESISQTSEKFWNVVLEKEFTAYSKKKEGYIDWSHLA
jgi:hypothetical protein